MVPTGFDDDAGEDELLNRHERDSRLPTIEEELKYEIPNIHYFEQATKLD